MSAPARLALALLVPLLLAPPALALGAEAVAPEAPAADADAAAFAPKSAAPSPGGAGPAAPPTAGEIRLDDPEWLARARAYTRGNWLLFLADSAWTMLALAALVLAGVPARAWAAIRSRLGGGAAGTLVFISGFVIVLSLLSLPFDLWDGFFREHAYGFSNQSLGEWAADRIRTLGLTLVLAPIFLVPVYAVIRRFPRSWWALGAALSILLAVFLVAIAPVVVDPIFNDFTPLADASLRRTILDLAHRNGIPADEVFEMDASSRSAHDNAYVAGLLGSQRIVLYDNLLRSYPPEEITFVMAHEMGHYLLGHVWKGLGLAAVLIVAAFFAAHRVVNAVVAKAGGRTGLASAGEIATLPLMALILSAALFVTLPIQSAFSRALESEADRFALREAPRPEAGPGAFRRMASRNLSDPDPPAVVEWLLYSHPAIGRRIRTAEAYLASLPEAGPGG